MRVGLISDTHGQLRPQVFDHFAGVARILHAGDVGSAAILDELEVLAPVTAVSGNVDGFELRDRAPDAASLELEGRRVVVVHGHRLGSPTSAALLAAHPDADIVVFGHTHEATVERIGRRLAVNPGAAGPARFGARPTIAILELSAGGEDVRVIEL